ncbi:MAG: hypothetical protein WAL71_10890 [Terriglobales bacterium]|jgi:hypothetical protein
MATDSVELITRWIARVWSILCFALVLAFAVTEVLQGSGPSPTRNEWLGLVFWPIGVCVGLAVAWLREELGGSLALGCLIAFYVWNLVRSGHWPQGPFFFLIAAPGLVFLLAGFLSHRAAAHKS